MQFSKLFFTVGVIAVSAGVMAVRAQDTPAQATARAALMQQMNSLEPQPAQPAPPPIMVTPAGAKQVKPGQPTNAAVTAHPPAAVAAAPAPKPMPVPAAPPASPAAPVQTQPNLTTPAVAHAAQAQPATVNPVKPAPPVVKPEKMPPPKGTNYFVGKELGLKPIVAPPVPISATKQARLQALLVKYQNDQITPEQYHTQRAQILAEP